MTALHDAAAVPSARGDIDIARRFLVTAGDHRLLNPIRYAVEVSYCLDAAEHIRRELTALLSTADDTTLRTAMIETRAALRRYMQYAGANGVLFLADATRFHSATTELRRQVATAAIAVSRTFRVPLPTGYEHVVVRRAR